MAGGQRLCCKSTTSKTPLERCVKRGMWSRVNLMRQAAAMAGALFNRMKLEPILEAQHRSLTYAFHLKPVIF